MQLKGISITIKGRLSGLRAVHVRWMVSGGAIRVLSGFIANLVLVRFISPEEFGRFALVLASIGIVFAFHPFRIYNQILRIKESEFDEDTQQLYFSVLIQQSFVFGLIALGVVNSTSLRSMWSLLLLGSIVLNHFTQNVKGFFERKMPYKRLAVIETAALVGGHLLSIIIAVSWAGAAALYVREAFAAISSLVLLWLMGGLVWHKVRMISLFEWRSLFKQGSGIWLDATLEAVFHRSFSIIAFMVGGVRGAGFFFQAQRLATFPHLLLTPVVSRMALNWFSHEENSKLRWKSMQKLLVYVAIPTALAALVVLFCADIFIPFLFGESWIPVISILKNMSGYIIFISLFTILQMYFIATHNISRLIVGRVVQILVLAIVPALTYAGIQTSVASFGLSLSFAFMSAFIMCFILVWLYERRV